MATSPRGRYHHGDLPTALVDAATALARKGGPRAVLLRAVAREVGVSPTAAYRHFSDHEALLEAVRNRCTGELVATMQARLAEVDPDADDDASARALERFRAVGQGYLDFALHEPGLFATAFDTSVLETHDEDLPPRKPPNGRPVQGSPAPVADAAGPPPGAEPPTDAFDILAGVLDELTATGVLDRTRREHAEIPAWAAVHGLAMLLHGSLRDLDDDTRTSMIDRTLDLVARGL